MWRRVQGRVQAGTLALLFLYIENYLKQKKMAHGCAVFGERNPLETTATSKDNAPLLPLDENQIAKLGVA